jgi:hypothetical protein
LATFNRALDEDACVNLETHIIEEPPIPEPTPEEEEEERRKREIMEQ